MEVLIRDTRDQAVSLTAALIARALVQKPNLVLGLATGRTMESVYELLVAMYEDDGLDFSLARTFNLDEYVGLPPEDPNSYRFYMNKHLFHRVKSTCAIPICRRDGGRFEASAGSTRRRSGTATESISRYWGSAGPGISVSRAPSSMRSRRGQKP